MIRLFWFLLDGCWHEYERVKGPVIDHYDHSFGGPSFMYRSIPCQCKKCGKFSEFKDKSGGVE